MVLVPCNISTKSVNIGDRKFSKKKLLNNQIKRIQICISLEASARFIRIAFRGLSSGQYFQTGSFRLLVFVLDTQNSYSILSV